MIYKAPKSQKEFSAVPELFFSVSIQWRLKTKTIMKLYCHYCTSLIIVSFMTSLC